MSSDDESADLTDVRTERKLKVINGQVCVMSAKVQAWPLGLLMQGTKFKNKNNINYYLWEIQTEHCVPWPLLADSGPCASWVCSDLTGKLPPALRSPRGAWLHPFPINGNASRRNLRAFGLGWLRPGGTLVPNPLPLRNPSGPNSPLLFGDGGFSVPGPAKARPTKKNLQMHPWMHMRHRYTVTRNSTRTPMRLVPWSRRVTFTLACALGLLLPQPLGDDDTLVLPSPTAAAPAGAASTPGAVERDDAR